MVKKKLSDSFRPILFSLDKKPLSLWSKFTRSGRVKRVDDDDLHTKAIEIYGTDPKNTYISSPTDPMASLDITLPILVMLLKNMDKDLQILSTPIKENCMSLVHGRTIPTKWPPSVDEYNANFCG
uniref:CFA20 domain-containing protein n=1 Tax=Timema poppense TaxID=170557 RepID=A0A7R9HDA1_TIMPO|nr:unnamed protein product [Timema poppensis]